MIDEEVVSEFEREIEFLQRTRHHHLVRFHGAGRFGPARENAPFLVLEFANRGSLRNYVRVENKLGWDLKEQLLLHIARGLNHIHSLGPNMMHRYLSG